jgi:hypothetical protein
MRLFETESTLTYPPRLRQIHSAHASYVCTSRQDRLTALNVLSMPSSFFYAAERMYGIRSAGVQNGSAGKYLRSMLPHVLHPEGQPLVLSIDIGHFSGPAKLGEPALERPVKLYNPSITTAPAGLCPQCAFIAAVRADALHQCDTSSPLFARATGNMRRTLATGAYFKNSAVVVLGLGFSHARRCRLQRGRPMNERMSRQAFRTASRRHGQLKSMTCVSSTLMEGTSLQLTTAQLASSPSRSFI